MKKLKGLASIKNAKQSSTMSKLSGLGDVRQGKGKAVGRLMPKDGLQMSKRKGLGDELRGRKGKGGFSEYVNSFNRPSGSERQAALYRGKGLG
jgi:hypothetical protein